MRTAAAAVGLAALALSGLGKTIDTTHSAVVAIAVDQPGRSPATGTLVADRVVLTAGHVSPAPDSAAQNWAVSVGSNAFAPERRVRFTPASSRPHPLFLQAIQAFGRFPTERPDFIDLGLVLLPEPAGVAPAALAAAGVLDRVSPGDRFVGVGYGYDNVVRPDDAAGAGAADGQRRRWTVGIRVLNEAWIRLDDDPGRGFGQICRGDSGAPIFLVRRGREMLVAVVSHSDGQGCGPGVPTYAARVDRADILAWIHGAIDDAR